MRSTVILLQLSVENAMEINATEMTAAMVANESVYAEQGIFDSVCDDLKRCQLSKQARWRLTNARTL